jgi:hypothetical protein
MVAMKNRQWGDLLEEEEELPPTTTSGPDAKGIVTKVEHYRNDKGEVMKRTTRSRVVKIEKKVFQVGLCCTKHLFVCKASVPTDQPSIVAVWRWHHVIKYRGSGCTKTICGFPANLNADGTRTEVALEEVW